VQERVCVGSTPERTPRNNNKNDNDDDYDVITIIWLENLEEKDQ
jgi:hypothetical protein